MNKTYGGWNVLEISSGFGAASLAGKIFADLGSTVLKVELASNDSLRSDPGKGDQEDAMLYDLINGNKHGLGYRFGQDEKLVYLNKLLSGVDLWLIDDVFLRIFKARHGCVDRLHQHHPHLTIAVCTPFGMAGDLADWHGDEELIQAITGTMSVTGHMGEEPTRMASSMMTHGAALFTVTSAIADLYQKKQSKQGSLLDISMFDSAFSYLTPFLPAYDLTGSSPSGIGNRHTMSAPWNTFQCLDGWIVICAGNNSVWERICKVIGREDLIENPAYDSQEKRVEHADEVDAEITKWTMDKPVKEVERILDEQSIPCGPILSLDQVLEHEYFKHQQLLLKEVESYLSGPIFQFSEQPLAVSFKPMRPGEATSMLLDELGWSASHYNEALEQHVLYELKEG